MKRGGGLHPARPDWWPPTKRQRDVLVSRGGCAPVLAHVSSFGRNPRGSPDFPAYPVPKACMHVLGTWVPRSLGVARSASSPKAAQALGCSLTPGLRISFGPVTCMARAASVPGLWTLGFLLLCGASVWVWFVLGLGFWLRPATPGWGDGVFVCSLRLYPATPGWGVRCGCVCFGSGFGCPPPLVAGMMGCVCACVHSPLVLRHSWGVRCGCVCMGWGFGCAPPQLAGVLGCVCACVRAPLVPRLSSLGSVVCGFGVAWHLFLCLGSLRVVRAARVCGTQWPLLLGTCPCALVVAGGLPPWGAWWPCLVRRASSGPVALGALVGFPDAVVPFPSPGACAPCFTGWLRGARGGRQEPGSLCLPLAPAEAGALGSLRVVPVRGPAMGLSLAGPSGVGLGLRALRWFACVGPVTDASNFPYRTSSDRGLGRCTGAVPFGRRHRPLWAGGRHARVPCVCACACPSWPGRAGRPPGRVLVCLTFSCGRSWCALCLFGPLGLWLPSLWLWGVSVFSFFFFVSPPLSPAFFVFRPGVPWALASCGPPA